MALLELRDDEQGVVRITVEWLTVELLTTGGKPKELLSRSIAYDDKQSAEYVAERMTTIIDTVVDVALLDGVVRADYRENK